MNVIQTMAVNRTLTRPELRLRNLWSAMTTISCTKHELKLTWEMLYQVWTDPLHKWRLKLNNKICSLYILSLTFIFQDKRISHECGGLGLPHTSRFLSHNCRFFVGVKSG